MFILHDHGLAHLRNYFTNDIIIQTRDNYLGLYTIRRHVGKKAKILNLSNLPRITVSQLRSGRSKENYDRIKSY